MFFLLKMYALLNLRAVRLFAAQVLCGSVTRTFGCAARFDESDVILESYRYEQNVAIPFLKGFVIDCT